MYDFKITASDMATLYRDLAQALEALVEGEPDPVANMANAAALIWESLPDLNWAGFYRNLGGELVLGPFQGRPACNSCGMCSGFGCPTNARGDALVSFLKPAVRTGRVRVIA